MCHPSPVLRRAAPGWPWATMLWIGFRICQRQVQLEVLTERCDQSLVWHRRLPRQFATLGMYLVFGPWQTPNPTPFRWCHGVIAVVSVGQLMHSKMSVATSAVRILSDHPTSSTGSTGSTVLVTGDPGGAWWSKSSPFFVAYPVYRWVRTLNCGYISTYICNCTPK